MGRPHVTPKHAGHAYDDGTRRTEILQTAALLIATSGLRTSLQEIADAAGILPGSLYHHFESKEAILVELLRRYHSDLDRIAERAHDQIGRARLAVCVRPDRGSELCDRTVRGDPSRRAADDLLRGPELESGTDSSGAAAADGDSGGDAADPAGRTVERLRQVRRRPARPCRPDRPDDAAGRTRRHPAQRRRRQVGHLLCRILLEGLAAVPPTDAELDRLRRVHRRRRSRAVVGRTTAKPRPTTRPRTSVPSPEPSSAARATKSRPSGTSPRPREWAPARCTG